MHNSLKKQETVGVALVGHGTRKSSGQEQFKEVFRQFEQFMAPVPCELAFLELADPDIPTAIERLAQRGVSAVQAVPVLLFTAGHALEDIPSELQQAAVTSRVSLLPQVPALECCQPILDLSAKRFREAVCYPDERSPDRLKQLAQSTTCSNCIGCKGPDFCSSSALLMVGRGSNSAQATQEMNRLCSLRHAATKCQSATACFIHGQQPNLEDGFQWLSKQDTELAVVQPHLLFDGLLMDDLRERVNYWADRQPRRTWLLTETLGVDASLARTLADFASSMLPNNA